MYLITLVLISENERLVSWRVELNSQSEMFGGDGSGPETLNANRGDEPSDPAILELDVPALTAIVCSPAK